MKQNRKIKIIFSSFLLAILLFANSASAALITCGGYNPDKSPQNPCAIGDLIGTIKLLINYLLAFAWLVSILFIVVSGIRMILARGNEEALTSAKSSLSNAIIGFIIILTSFVILNLVISLITGGNLTDAFDLLKTKK